MSDSSRRQSRRQSKRQSQVSKKRKKTSLTAKSSKSQQSRISKYGKDLADKYPIAMELTILSIENLVAQNYPVEVCVMVYYNDEVIGISQGVAVENAEPVELNFVLDVKLQEASLDSLFDIISKPIIITLNVGRGLQGRAPVGGKVITPKSGSRKSVSSQKSTGSRKSMKRKSSVKRQSRASTGGKRKSQVRRGSVKSTGGKSGKSNQSGSGRTPTTGMPSTTVLGKGTIDILPLIQGECRIEEDIVMEVPEKLQGPDLRPYTSLPFVKIRLIDIDQLSQILPPLANIAFFTIESMYNAVFSHSANCFYYATVPVPLTPVEPNEDREAQLLHFQHAVVEEYVDINFRKKWYTIANSPGRTCLTKYKINYKFDDVKDQDDVGVDFTKLPIVKEPRVNWNSLRRMWFTPKHELYFKDTIIKYRLWPVEITVSPSGALDLSERVKISNVNEEIAPISAESAGKRTKAATAPLAKGSGGRKSMARKSVAKGAAGGKEQSRKSLAKAGEARKSVAKRASKAGKGARKSMARKSAVGSKSAPGERKSMAKRASRAGSGKSISGRQTSRSRSISKEPGKEKKERKPANPDIKHFIAYVDLSCLLFPGVTSTRAACRLFTYNQEDAVHKWGLSESMMGWLVPPPGTFPPLYVMPPLPVEITTALSPVSPPNNVQKGGFGQTTEGEKAEEISGEEEEMTPEIHYETPLTVPVKTEDGRPVYIIVEVALLNPLVKKKTEEETVIALQDLLKMPKAHIVDKQALTKIATTQFENSIMTITELLNKEYKDYQELRHSFIEPFLHYDEKAFYGHLENSGALSAIQETLQESITSYAIDVVGAPQSEETQPTELLNYISNLYRRLVEDMYKIVNYYDMDYQFTGYFEDVNKIGFPSQDDLLFFAAEAREQGQYEKSKYYLLKRLEGNNARNPDYWLDYATNALRFGDIAAALEATKETLALDIRHKEGLLMHAVLLTMSGDLDGAEIFFSACRDFHPLFLEGWTAWYIFYLLTERAEAADVTFILANKTLNDLKPAFETLKVPLLTWDEVPMNENLFMRAALYFLRFNLFEFAEICLAKQLEKKGMQELEYYYYLAVSHHLMGRYADSISHLDEALRMHWENPLVWSLMGHNHYRLGQIEKAMKAYDFALNEMNNDDDPHLIWLRKGFHFLDSNEAEEAKKCFLQTLVKHQTPLGWLGLGMACYALDDINDAEMALVESNSLDSTLALTWAYLALVNLRRVNYDLFTQCLAQARKYGLDDAELLDKIEAMRQEIVCEDSSVIQLKKMAQHHGIFRNDLLKSFMTSNQIPSVGFKKAESEMEDSSPGREAEGQVDSPAKSDDCDVVPTHDFDSGGQTDEEESHTPNALLQVESSTMITKYFTAVQPCPCENPQPERIERVHRFDTNNSFANENLD